MNSMTQLKRSPYRFYLPLIGLLLACITSTIGIAFMSLSNFSIDRRVLAIIFLAAVVLAAIYFSIALIKKIPLIKFDGDKIYIERKAMNWKDVQSIYFNSDVFFWGSPTIRIEFTDKNQNKQLIYSKYYSNYLELHRFIFGHQNEFTQTEIMPQTEGVASVAIQNKEYSKYNFLSLHFFTALFCVGFFAYLLFLTVESKPANPILYLIPVLYCILLFALWYIPCTIIINNNLLIVKRAFFSRNLRAYPLTSLYSVRVINAGRYNKLQVITNEFELENYDVRSLSDKTLNTLLKDLEATQQFYPLKNQELKRPLITT